MNANQGGNQNPMASSAALVTVAETEQGTSDSKAAPKDAQVITEILKDMGISEWEPKVVNQLMEFLYR